MEYKILSFKKSLDKKHKYVVVLLNLETNKEYTVKFGAYGMNDYTIYYKMYGKEFAEKKRKAYIARHKVNEVKYWNNPNYPSYWSRWLLWEEPNINDAYKKIRQDLLKWKII